MSYSPTDNFTSDLPLESAEYKRPLVVNPLIASIRNRAKVFGESVSAEEKSSTEESRVASTDVRDISIDRSAEGKVLTSEQEKIVNTFKRMVNMLPLGAKASTKGYDLSGVREETADKGAEVERLLTEHFLNHKEKKVSKKIVLPLKKVEVMQLADFLRPIDDIRGKLNTQTASSIVNSDYLRSAINSGNVDAAILLMRKVANAKPVEISNEQKQSLLREASVMLIQNIENLSTARDQDGKTAVDSAKIAIEEVKEKYSRIESLPIDAPEFEQAREDLTFEQFKQQNRALPKVLKEKYRIALLDKVYPNRKKDQQTEIQAATEVLEAEKNKIEAKVSSIAAVIGVAIKNGVDPAVLTVEARKIENPTAKGVINSAISSAKQTSTSSPTKSVKETKTPVKSIIEDGEALHADTIKIINVYHTKASDETISSENKTVLQKDVKDAVMCDLVTHAIQLRKYNEALEAGGSECPDLEKYLEAAFKHNMRKALNYKQDPALAQNNEILITAMLKSFKAEISDPEMIALVEVPIEGVDIRDEMKKSLRKLGVKEDSIKLGTAVEKQKTSLIESATSINSRPSIVPDIRTGDRGKSVNTV